MKAEQVLPPTHLARRFVRYILGFFVGVAIGMAPFLGSVNVPGFKALLNVMPFQITSDLIPLSAFLTGIIVVVVQFYAGERTPLSVLKKLFRIALSVITVGFVLFVILRDQFTVGVRRGGSRVTVLISSSPVASTQENPKPCGDCEDPKGSPASCIRRLSFEEEAIERCWGYEGLTRRSQILKLSYLILTGGVGVLIGFLLLKEEARRQKKKASNQGKESTLARPIGPKSALTPAPMRVLLVCANPRGTGPLRTGEEDKTLRDSLRQSPNRDSIEVETLNAATVDDLRRALRQKGFDIVHFSGHGTPTGLVFEDATGELMTPPPDALAGLLKRRKVKVAVLNACYSLSVGKLSAIGMEYTIASTGPISDPGAIEFTRGFYDALGAGESVPDAYKEGLSAAQLKGYHVDAVILRKGEEYVPGPSATPVTDPRIPSS